MVACSADPWANWSAGTLESLLAKTWGLPEAEVKASLRVVMMADLTAVQKDKNSADSMDEHWAECLAGDSDLN